MMMEDPVMSYNLRRFQDYVFGLWLWLRSWLLIPATYVCAIYCCLVELYIDTFHSISTKELSDEWSRSTLLTEERDEKRIAVLTGADGTIGTEICRLLLQFGYEIVIFGMRRPHLSYLRDWDRLHLFKCDFLVPNQVSHALNEFQRQFKYVDLCIFNAGVMLHPPLTDPNAVDPHHRVNLLSHALIFESIRPYMDRSPRSSPKVIAVSSSTYRLSDLQRFIYGDPTRAFRHYHNGYKSYADSKLYLNLYFRYLPNVLQKSHSRIKVASVHPGVVPGLLYRHVFFPFRFLINHILKFIIRGSRQAAIDVLSLAFNDNIKTGSYYEYCRANDFKGQYSDLDLRRLYEAAQMEIR